MSYHFSKLLAEAGAENDKMLALIHLAETVRPFNKDGRAVSTRDRNPS
ncbi:hypothetical protein [Paenibacillus sp. MER TA 81-3]|nr:hypothetical protein [Paenibacillus sp. MER TA 81-3]